MSIGKLTPARDGGTVAPSDSTVLEFRQLFVGGAGNVSVIAKSGNTVTFTGVVAGSFIDIEGTKVLSTGTTATNITWLG